METIWLVLIVVVIIVNVVHFGRWSIGRNKVLAQFEENSEIIRKNCEELERMHKCGVEPWQFPPESESAPQAPDSSIAPLSDPWVSGQQRVDVYDEVSKLGNLRERGLLTDAEFNEEKKKVLSRQ